MDTTTQRDRILRLLQSHSGQWVSLLKILDEQIAQYNARLLELRRMGYVIEMRSEYQGRRRFTWYRLLSGPAQ